jgi:DNA-binding beta-propeller fold protein YncE
MKGSHMARSCSWVLAALALLGVYGFGGGAERTDTEYRLLKTIKLGGEGSWDYLSMDPDGRRLYIARGNRIMVVDVDDGKLVGEIANTPGVHGLALDTKRGQGFTSNGGDSTASIVDLKTLKEKTRIKVGKGPDFITYDPASERAFTFNAGGKDATAISGVTGQVDGSVELGGRPEAAIADEKGMVYVNIVDKHAVVAFDAKNLKVVSRWPIAPAKTPVGIAIDKTKRRLFVTCRGDSPAMVIMNADSGKILSSLPIGKGTDAAAFDPATGLAFSSNGGDANVTVVEEAKAGEFRVAGNVNSQSGAKTMALDTKTHNLYLVTAKGTGKQQEPGSFVLLVVGK